MNLCDLNTIEDKVCLLLEEYPETRNSDKYLTMHFFRLYHDIHTFKGYCEAEGLPSLESIRRCRQKIQARGEYPSDKQIAEWRKVEERNFRNYSLF